MYPKVKKVLENILHCFKTGDVPKAIAYSMFPIPNIPASQWSLCNRTLMFFSGTQDAREFGQWLRAGRQVKKGAKAFYILAPRFVKKDNGDGDKKVLLVGFLAVPVFKCEDTEGAALDYEKVALPDLPLIEVAERWGVSVRAIPGNYRCYGYYSDSKQEIALATEDEVVFFHELSHAAHAKIIGSLKPGQDWKQEIVAELSAAALCHLIGKDGDKYLGNAYRYIESYAKEAKISALKGCLQVIADVESVLLTILTEGEKNWARNQPESLSRETAIAITAM